MNRILCTGAFALGLAVLGWVAYGYIGSNALALAMTLLIAAFYAMGAVELHRFRRATAGLNAALAALPERLPERLPDLGGWLATLPPTLQNPVRLRVAGERAGLPGPQMTPYLVGLLVLLGMLGTFLGMVVTLNGAVKALETTSDLSAMRAALAAPVKGLGLAFGTSVAGVAASAMLGLVAALCRRERVQVGQRLDARVATTLREHSRAHQREQTLETLQAQARVMPEVVARLEALMAQIDQRAEHLDTTLRAGQDRFHAHAQTAYSDLAASVDRSLKESLTEGARAAAATIQPVVGATMAGIARETAALQGHLSDAVERQLDGLSGRFDATVATVSHTWTAALEKHEATSEALTNRLTVGLDRSLGQFNQTFDARTAALLATVEGSQAALHGELATAAADLAHQTGALHLQVAETVAQQLDGVATRFAATADTVSAAWRDTAAQQAGSSEALCAGLDRTLGGFTQTFETRSAALLASVEDRHAALQRELEDATAALTQRHAATHAQWAGTVAQQLDDVTRRFGDTATTVADGWRTALAEQARQGADQTAGLDGALARFTQTFDARSTALLASVDARQTALQAELGAAAAGLTRHSAAMHEQMAATVAQQLDAVVERFGSTAGTVSDGWGSALAEQARGAEALTGGLEQALSRYTQTFEARTAALLDSVAARHSALEQTLQTSVAELTRQTGVLHGQLTASAALQLGAVAERFGATATDVAGSWHDALAAQQHTSKTLAGGLQASLAALVQTSEQQASALLATVERAHAALRADTVESDRSRLAAWTGTLEQMAAALQKGWLEAGEQGAAQQVAICRTLEQTAHDLHTQAGAQARETVAEMARLISAASEAPRAAAEVVGALREQLSAAMTRDNVLLDERSRILATLDTLLDAVHRGATEQRVAIDALVASSAGVLERAGAAFGARVEAEAGKLEAVAVQVSGSAIEVGSMGEAFGAAVQQFGQSSEALTAQLARIEGALAKSTARSDEQLAYYVAQAREIVDLSISAQQQIVEDLQRLAIRPPAAAAALA